MSRENVYDLARKALALLMLGFEPRKNESLDGFVSRCESELRRATLAKDEDYAKSST